MRKPLARQEGFTLIEVMVALALMALLSVISWRALDSVERANGHLVANADDALALVRMMEQLETDIALHAGPAILSSHPVWNPAAKNGALLPPGIHWGDSQLAIVRSAQDGQWQSVVWKATDRSLQRWSGVAARTLPLPAASSRESMLASVHDFSARMWIPGQGWTAPDRASIADRSASGLEITIGREVNGKTERYRKVMVLP
ncbi:type II secretion system protein J [Bordetella sp. 15P40C-2]|uniref:PulJ/GspJ family protein n=1 Tax=Bordetella sp. 15P40C-2 TaxID=2572246 RepID=UPI0013206D1A|nr:prepilin-type N-terminal cleavage/methylation domain-containing protein [Bordetella sp. 15P40C-2]MVW72507.1 prepilin-type N-terminal cleavage/methylation domain-containing protein [Bordetella sp. 15P40C-2]